MSFTRNNRNISATAATPFCKVCFDAHLPASDYTSHFVKDQPGQNGKVVCPTLLAQKCLICGVAGHTSSYCPDNSSVSSSVSSSSSSSTVQNQTRYKLATDEIRQPVRQPVHSIRLSPIKHRTAPTPRIVYATDIQPKTTTTNTKSNKTENESAFPALPNLSSLRRFENDEPRLRREMPVAAASPVHSPSPSPSPIKLKYNKNSNRFGALVNNVDSGDDSDHETSLPPVQKQKKPASSSSSSSSSSWASIAAGSKSTVVAASKQPLAQQRARSRFSIVVPTAAPLALLPPPSFKPKPVSVSTSDLEKKKQVKKLWGDTDSEDDEEFLKRGLN
jgi:hypothetical protein